MVKSFISTCGVDFASVMHRVVLWRVSGSWWICFGYGSCGVVVALCRGFGWIGCVLVATNAIVFMFRAGGTVIFGICFFYIIYDIRYLIYDI